MLLRSLLAFVAIARILVADSGVASAADVRGNISVASDFLESEAASGGPRASFWEEENGVIPTLPPRVDLAREVAVVLMAPSGGAGGAGSTAPVDVRLEGGGATPAVVVVRPRTTVRFVNTDINAHELH